MTKITDHFHNSNEKSAKAQSRQPQSRQPQSKQPQSFPEMQKPSKFQLMPFVEYIKMKGGLDGQISKSYEDFDIADYIYNTLKRPRNNENNENQIALLLVSQLKFKNTKLEQISQLQWYHRCFDKYERKLFEYMHRLKVMSKIHGLLPRIVSENAVDIIRKYVSLGFDAAYSIQPILTCLDKISLELLDEFKASTKDFEKTQNTTLIDQPKYQPFIEFCKLFIAFDNKIISGYKRAYLTYKQYLIFILQINYVSAGKSEAYYKQYIFEYIKKESMPSQLLDHHLFLQIWRTLLNCNPNEPFSMPYLSPEQFNQLTIYLEEINHIVFINIIVSEEYNIPHNIFTALPVSLTINKKPKDFFGKPISKNTFSILLEYLGNVTKAFTIKTLKYFESIKKQ